VSFSVRKRVAGRHHDTENGADHAVKLVELPDDQMADILPTCKKLAAATVRRPAAISRCK